MPNSSLKVISENTIFNSMKIISRCHCTSIHTFIDYIFFQTNVPIRDSYSLLKQRVPLFQWLAYLNDKNDDCKHELSLYAVCREMKIEEIVHWAKFEGRSL